MLTEPTRRVIRTAGSCSGLMFCVLAGCATGRIGGGCCVPIDGLRLSTSVARTNRVAVLPAPYARETLIVSIDDCRAYESSDRGVHWRPAREDLSIPFGWYSYGTYPIDRQVQYRPNDVYHQGADTWTRLLERSNDGGVTWVPVKCLLMPGAQRLEPRELIYHPTDPNFVIALAKDSGIDQDREMGFYLSRDGGETFKRVLALAGTKFAVSQRNPDVFYAVSDDLTVYRSGDAGDRWVVVWEAAPVRNTLLERAKSDGVALDPSLSSKYERCRFLVIDPKDPDTVYIGTDVGVFRTRDGGGSWCAIDVGGLANLVYRMVVDPSDTRIIYLGTYAGLYVSTDGGCSWAKRQIESKGLMRWIREVVWKGRDG